MKKFASDLQIFLGRRNLEAEVMKKEKMIEEISTDETLTTQHIVFQENAVLATLQSSLSSLGELSVVTRPSNIPKLTPKVDQAQINTTRINNFDNMNLVIRQNIGVDINYIYGCVLTRNGKAVFSDYYRRCLLVKDAYSGNEDTIKLPAAPYDITCVDDKTLAVTFCSNTNKAINYVDLTSRKIVKTINDQQCYGICLLNGKLVYSTQEHGLKMLDLNNYSISKLNIGNSISDEYVATRNNKLYCTNNQASSVTCYNSDHSVAWVFQNSVLKGPRGITVDYHFNVYIGGQASSNVVVISPDGQKYKEFNLQITRPRTLYFEDKSKQILICGESGPAGIFSITM